MVGSKKRFRGGVLLTRIAYVTEKYGLEGVDKIRSELTKQGYHMPEFQKIKLAEWYPQEYNIAFLKVFRNMYGERAFIRLSKSAPFESEGFAKHFVRWPENPSELFTNADMLWHLFYDFGRLEGRIIGERDGEIYGYEVSDDPTFCEFLTHYFESLLENIAKSKVTVKHSECVYNGNDREKWEFKF